MSKLSDLPADEAATLRLLASGKTPADVADALSLEVSDVRRRALTGSDSLASETASQLAESERARVLAVLTGESASDPLLDSSPAARAYADEVATAVGFKLATSVQPTQELKKPDSKPDLPTPKPKEKKQGPRVQKKPANPDRGRGMILLACLGVVVVAIAIAAIAPWGDGGNETTSSGTNTTASSLQTNNGWTIRSVFQLKSVDGSKSGAKAGLETKGSDAQIVIVGLGIKPGTMVGVWLTGPSSNGLVGLQKVDAKGRFGGIGPLPANAQSANRLIVTSETGTPGQKVPAKPGPTLLSSPFSVS